jgi:hypothetical protein
MRLPTSLLRPGRLAVLALLALATLPASAPAAAPVLRLSATAVNLSGVGRAQAQTLTIVIERWSSDQERQKLLDVLIEKDADRLLDALQKVKPRAGYIRTNTSLGWDISYARQEELPTGGKRVIFGTDRPMAFYELRNSTRSADYDFMLCEIHLGPDGKGTGKLATAAKISYDKDLRKVEIENFGIEPVRLTEVHVEK